MSKYGVFSGPYFPVLSPNSGKYGPEKIPCLDTFHAVIVVKAEKLVPAIQKSSETVYNIVWAYEIRMIRSNNIYGQTSMT